MTDVTLLHGDCLELMPTLTKQSVAMVFADLPYGCTQASWDSQISLPTFWASLLRVVQKQWLCAMSARYPFSATLCVSNIRAAKYEIVWRKSLPTGHLNANRRPMLGHESILIFSHQYKTYNPQKTRRKEPHSAIGKPGSRKMSTSTLYGKFMDSEGKKTFLRYPTTVLSVCEEDINSHGLNGRKHRRIHPTQKPVALLEWLIKTYTNPGDTILDPVAGSGTTAIAAMRTGRRAICIEKDPVYFAAMTKRVADERANMTQPAHTS